MKNFNFKWLLLSFALSVAGISQVWGDNYYLRYMEDMPSDYHDGNTSVQMTQSANNSNRYYCVLDLTTNHSYGFFIRVNDSENSCWKADATKGSNECHELSSYSGQHGNSSHRLTFNCTSTGKYVFTYDISNHHICVSPLVETVKIAWDVATGNDGAYNLSHYEELTHENSTSIYYYKDFDNDFTSGWKYYMFVQIANGTYYKGTSELSAGNWVSLYNYGTNNYGNSGDKINFTPSATGRYRFTWNHADKTVTYERLWTVEYDGNDKTSGDVPETSYHLSGSTVTVASNGGTLAKNGYSFDGWNTASDGSGTNYTAGSGTFTKASSSETLYARWTATITLNKNNSVDGKVNGTATTYYKNGELTISSAPTNATGYYVTGYYDAAGTNMIADADGVLQASITGYTDASGKWTATESKTLYAHWSNEYTVSFNEHDADIHGTTDPVTATYGSAMPAISVPSKTGYLFGGYWTGEGGTGTQYYNANGSSATNWVGTSPTTLHALWTPITYYVAFDANEGSGSIENQEMTYNVAANLTSNTTQITRSGFYFLGWNSRADGHGTAYRDNKSVSNLTAVHEGIVTLYAQWAQTHTVYFVLAGVGWNPPYTKAQISYDGQTTYPLDANTGNWIAMEEIAEGITLSNASHGSGDDKNEYKLYKIDDVPEGSTIDFGSNSSGTSNVGYMSWTTEKPYFVYGNTSWYGLDATSPKRRIDQVTEMSVHLCELNSSNVVVATYDYGLNVHGSEKYAIAELKASTKYKYKYVNWIPENDVYSGYTNADIFIMNENTETGVSAVGALDDSPGQDVYFYTTVAGEYKFMLTWTGAGGTTPQTQMYYPVGVSLGALDVAQAVEGVSTTVTLTATPAKSYLITSPTYYYQMSTDNGESWATIGTSSSNTYAYTFAAQTCKFRVILENDAHLKSTSGTQTFTAISTKSFYVYNPYNTSGNWSYLHLYTWDSEHNNTKYNGFWPGGYIHCTDEAGTHGTSCLNQNDIVAMGDNWFYITINENANCFMLVGETPYNSHQTVTCYVNNYIQDGKYMIYTRNNANYVEEYDGKKTSDYRLKYTGRGSVTRYSPIYNTTLDGTTVTTSMWMNANDATAKLVIEEGTGSGWETKTTYSNSTKDGFGTKVPEGKRDTGHVFQMTLNMDGESSTLTDVVEYTGPYYVRTDGLTGGWNVYKKSDHIMYVSEESLHGTPRYDHYLCKWIGSSGTNVKFTVANDYNPELVASLGEDAILGSGVEKLPQATNVRFSWNSQTDTLTRAYLSGASSASSRFLVLVETTSPKGKIYNSTGTALTTAAGGKVEGLNEYELLFADNGNWVYQLDMQAEPGAQAKVTAKYNNQEPEFIPSTTLIGGDSGLKYKYRIVYDFKTNVLTNAWLADGNQINSSIILNTNVMLIREEQEPATQLTFGDKITMTVVKKVYGVMQFNKSTITNDGISRYERDLYWISFPFNVNLKDVFGMGDYGTHWIIEYYDGKGRAEHGFWADSPSNWKFVTPAMRENGDDGNGYILEANTGYILALDLDELGTTSSVWDNGVTAAFIYFPSTDNINNIQNVTSKDINIDQTGYQCKINRGTTEGDRRIKDSYWHCIGVPSYANKTRTDITASDPTTDDLHWVEELWVPTDLLYFYNWNSEDNTLSVENTSASKRFDAMHSYLVQYSSTTLTWENVTNTSAGVAARLNETPDREYNLQLMLYNEEQDHTYVRLTDDANVTNRFEFNYDLSKEYNAGRGNIWTVTADTVEVAGNSMPKPLQTTLVPVGVKVVANGDYTFSMPEGTNGEDVYLIDNAYGTRTNLGLMPYTVTLTAGTYDSRFVLEFAPIQDSPTSFENDGLSRSDELNDAIDGVRKVFVGGRLYIIRDGKVYDAAGQRIE